MHKPLKMAHNANRVLREPTAWIDGPEHKLVNGMKLKEKDLPGPVELFFRQEWVAVAVTLTLTLMIAFLAKSP